MKLVKYSWLFEDTLRSWPFNDKVLDDLSLAMRRRLTPLGRKAIQIVRCTISWITLQFLGLSHLEMEIQAADFNLLSNLFQGEMLSPTDLTCLCTMQL